LGIINPNYANEHALAESESGRQITEQVFIEAVDLGNLPPRPEATVS